MTGQELRDVWQRVYRAELRAHTDKFVRPAPILDWDNLDESTRRAWDRVAVRMDEPAREVFERNERGWVVHVDEIGDAMLKAWAAVDEARAAKAPTRFITPKDGNPCEWNVVDDRASQDGDPWHADATVSMGINPSWHVCQACSELPRFKRYRKRTAIGAARAAKAAP